MSRRGRTPTVRARISRPGDLLGGPISFGLDRPLTVTKFYRKPPKGFVSTDRRLDIKRLVGVGRAELRRNSPRIKAVLDSMPWSEIEEALKRLPKELRRILRKLAEE